MPIPPLTRLLAMVSAFWLAFLPGLAHAQTADGGSGGEVEIDLQHFGVGSAVRPGDWAGLRVVLKDLGDEVRDVAVRLHLEDPDGDTLLQQREVILTPGVSLGAWIYAVMPWDLTPSSALTITVHEADTTGERPIVGRQIGYERVAPDRLLDPERSMNAVVGRQTFGLLQYEQSGPSQSGGLPVSHEWPRIVQNVGVGDLPTEWMGLAPFETIVWTEGDPTRIESAAVANAVREWVMRGGHLVVVMEPVGDGWFTEANPLRDVLPDVTTVRHEDVDLEPYRDLLGRPGAGSGGSEMPGGAIVHSFSRNETATRSDAIGVAQGPQGTVISRKLLGAGMVTVVGIDLSAGGIGRRGLVRADAFWNRILGKRSDALSGARQGASRSSGIAAAIRSIGDVYADRFIAVEINLTGTVSVGVLFGLGLFSIYWLVSGFGSFAALRSRALERHAWVVFVLVIALFTGIAWAGARVLKPTDVSTLHVTFLDHVYGQQFERGRSFMSVMLPEYGTQRVAIPAQSEDRPWRNALTPWADPTDIGTQRSFPDARPYVVSTNRPDSMPVPARQTVKQFRADWLGAPRWTMPIPTGDGAHPRADRAGELSGVLVHDLPSALEEVVIFHVKGQRSIEEIHERWSAGETGVLMFETAAVKLPDPWTPGTPLDLGAIFAQADGEIARGDRYLSNIVPRKRPGEVLAAAGRGDESDYNLINFHGVLAQPEYDEEDVTRARRALVRRRMTHTLGMGQWFTSPCVIITGQVTGAPSPVPLEIDGEPIDSVGRTIVRWVYPLDDRPLRVR